VKHPPRPIDTAYQAIDSTRDVFRRIMFGLFVLTGLLYLGWRVTVFNPGAPILSAIFFATEFVGFLGSLLLFFVTFAPRVRVPRAAPEGLSVDVFVTTCNEDVAVVRRTLVAATRIRYPHQTWLLDDGNRLEFREMADELGCHYLARQENRGAKAGNLNYALGRSSGEFIALLDADHCADPILLDRLLGYFDDPLVAFVQTPQDYYNLNSFQHGRDRAAKLIWHEQSGFHHIEQPGRDHHSAATMCGCSCVLRRAHLEKIGGFPEETVTEDMHVAVKLQKRGFRSAYHDEPLAFGIAPPDLMGFLQQRLRWGEGNMQVCRIERLPFARGLTWRQNLCYLWLGFSYVDAWRKAALYAAPIFTLITGISPVFGEPRAFVFFITPFLICGMITYWEFYSGFGRMLRTEAYTMARLAAGLLASWGLFRQRIQFRVSSKQLISRRTFPLAIPQLIILIAGLYAIGAAILDLYHAKVGLPYSGMPLGVLATLAVLVAYHCLMAAFVLWYAVRSAYTDEMAYRFDICIPVRLSFHRTSVVGWTSEIWLEGAQLPVPEGFDRTATFVSVDVFLPGLRLRTTASVAPAGTEKIELRFNWLSAADRDELDQALHAGRWHRIVTGRYEVSRSPLQCLGLRSVAATRAPGACSEWEPVLVRKPASPQDPQLAYIRGGAANSSEIIMFSKTHGKMTVSADRTGTQEARSFEVGRPANTALLDEIALEGRNGVRYELEPLGAAEGASGLEALSMSE
jgi:cellulose synthase (UDP-forming)